MKLLLGSSAGRASKWNSVVVVQIPLRHPFYSFFSEPLSGLMVSLKILICAYNFIVKRITRSTNILGNFSVLLVILFIIASCYCRFSCTGTWEIVNLFLRTKNCSYHICYENTGRKHNKILWSQDRDRPWTDRTEQYASKEEFIKWNK